MASAASSSCSAFTSSAPFDVFINHRGPDVKKTFAAHLYHALKSRGLQVFLDRPELQAGHNFSCQIKAAIEVASVHVAIFSPTYADSKWCMEELVLMLKTAGIIIPVFYKVHPSDLRWTDKGAYAEALQHHEKKQRYDLKTIGDWRKALSQAADISGFELEDCNGDEVDLVDKIVKRVFELVPKPPIYVARYPVGLDEKLKDFERTVLSQPENEGQPVKVVGIVGTGGIGKSTLAKALINLKRSDYKTSSLLVDVRENATNKSINYLQKKLIKDLTGIDISIDSWQEGIGILRKNLKSCQAIIILDDADDSNQLDAFLPIKHVLDSKSLIVVTSRDKQVLINAGIANSSIYPLKGLDRSQSLDLFCWHAFFQSDPQSEFVDLVNGFLEACDGLPLSLEILGALLCQQDRSYWVDQLNGLQNLPRGIQERLRISYDSLEPEEQQIFLDIACFAIGESKDKWIKIWGGSCWKGSVGLRNLENKCLVEVDIENEIRMHDHLRDLGRSIAQEESMPRRLWSATIEDVYDLLEQSSSATKVRGIKMSPRFTRSGNWEEGSLGDEVFRISKLQLLEADGDIVEGILSKVRSPNLNLIWLTWMSCPCSSLPSWIPMRHLRGLEVYGEKLERLWQNESQAPVQLRELNIEAPLLEFPNSIGKLQHLEKIALGASASLFFTPALATLSEDVCCLPSLKYLVLKYCSKLQVLPTYFGNLTNLQCINLSHCSKLQTLPHSFCNLSNLREIDLEDCKSLEALPDALGTLRNLQAINLARCIQLKMLPSAIENLTNLREIDLEDCESLEALPDALWTLTNRQKISLQRCRSLKTLPSSIENITNLREIDLGDCKSLEMLPDALGTLTNLQVIILKRCRSLKMLPNSIGSLTNLRMINLKGCVSLETLPHNFGNLTNLQYIDASDSVNLQMPSNILGNLLRLQHLHLSGCHQLTISNETLGNITTLECLNLSGCLHVEVLPLQVLHQSSLRKLVLLMTNIKVFPSAPMTCLSNLQDFILESPLLKVLPPWLGHLKGLENLMLHGCRKLKCLPNSVEQLAQLKHLQISECGIQYLPPDVMKMNNLETLEVFGCPLRELPFKKGRGGGEPPFKKVRGGVEPSLSSTESSPRRKFDSSNQTCMIQLREIHLYLTEISEISFPEGVCPNLKSLTIRWCNRLVEVGALPTTLKDLDLRGCGALRKIEGLCGLANLQYLDLRGCGALRKIEGLCGLANLQGLDIRGCCALQVEEVPGHGSVISLDVLRPILRSLVVLKAPFETYDQENDREAEVKVRVVDLNDCGRCRVYSHFR